MSESIESIKYLIKKSAEFIRTENSFNWSSNSGEKPHFPMILFFNKSFPEDDINEIKDEMVRLWSYSTDKELYYKYNADNASFCFKTSQSDKFDLSVENISEAMNNTAKEEAFQSGHTEISKWYTFNIVESKKEDTAEMLKSDCCLSKVLTKGDSVIDRESLINVLIVFLEDPPYGNYPNITEKIKYLSGTDLYSSYNYETVIIFSDKKNNKQLIMRDEIIRLISDILVTINHDDENFKDRHNNYFKPVLGTDSFLYLVSYISLEKPIKKILYKIAGILLKTAIDNANTDDNKESTVSEIKGSINNIQYSNVHNSLFLDSLPLNRSLDGVITGKKYSEVSPILADSLIVDIISEQLVNSEDLDEYVPDLIQKIGNRYSLNNLKNGSTELKGVLKEVEQVCLNEPSNDLVLTDYFSQKVNQKLKRRIINLLNQKINNNEISENAKKTIDSLKELSEELNKEFISTDFDFSQYETIAHNYINNNSEEIKKISAIGNGKCDILDQMFKCIKTIVENNDLFRLSFIRENETIAGENNGTCINVSEMIKEQKLDKRKADGFELNNVCFTIAGSKVKESSLEVYFLKTKETTGRDTGLYTFLKRENDEFGDKIQYINTRLEDGIRVLTLYKVNPNDL